MTFAGKNYADAEHVDFLNVHQLIILI